jgi:hypothetical protein
LTELGGEKGLYFSTEDAAMLSRQFVEVCGSDSTRNEMITYGKSRLELFNPEKLTRSLIELYTS